MAGLVAGATIGSVIVTCNSILNAASAIQGLADDWYSVTNDFSSEVNRLRAKVNFYETEMDRHGMRPVDSSISKTVNEAEIMLQKKERKVRKLNDKIRRANCCYAFWWLYAKCKMIVLPQRPEKTLKQVEDQIDKITNSLKLQAEMTVHFIEWSARKAVPTTIHDNDELYVPIKKSVHQVIQAIQDTKGPRIILLHGGVGKGKSTLTRHICHLYGEYGEKKKDSCFDIVYSISCGNCAIPEPSTKQLEILQHLSPTSLDTSKKETTSSKARIARALYDFLRNKKILIILDDVSDERFLYEMWKAATGSTSAKYVVTSRRSDLCSSLRNYSLAIPMRDPDDDEATEILASLVGLENKVIPEKLQDIAERMIQETDKNPLALACLASNFTHAGDKTNRQAWQDAHRSLSYLLGYPQTRIVLGQSRDTTATSAWDAVRLCLDSLETVEAKLVLFLIYACGGKSVPEEVLRLLYDALITSSVTFFKASEELFAIELLKRDPGTLAPRFFSKDKDHKDEDTIESRTWSLRVLVKSYMNRHVAGRKEIKNILGVLCGEATLSQKSMQSILRGLFGDRQKAVAESSSTSKLGNANEDKKVDLQKTTREPTTPSIKKAVSLDSRLDSSPTLEPTLRRESSEKESAKRLHSEKKQVAEALCGLYFDVAHVDRNVAKYAGEARKKCKILKPRADPEAKSKRREAIEPIIWLLAQPKEDEAGWTESNIVSTRKVFLNYVLNCWFDEENILVMLETEYPTAQLAALKALASIFSMTETRSVDQYRKRLWRALENLLHSKEFTLREAASEALYYLCTRVTQSCSTFLVEQTHLLDALVSFIQSSLVSSNQGPEPEKSKRNATKNAYETTKILRCSLKVASPKTQST